MPHERDGDRGRLACIDLGEHLGHEHVGFGDPTWAERYWERRAFLLERLPAHTLERPTLDQPIDRWCAGPCDTGWSVELRPADRGIAGWVNARIDLRIPASGTLAAVRIVRRVGRDDTVEVAFGDDLIVDVPKDVDVDRFHHQVRVRTDTRAFLAQLVEGPPSLRAALKARIAAELATVVEFGGERQKQGECVEDRSEPGFEGAPPEVRTICMPTPMERAETAASIAGARADAARRQAVVDARYRELSAALEPVRGWLGEL